MAGGQFIEMPPSGPVFFGPGEAARVGELVRNLGASRAFVVCDPGIAASGILDKVRESLEKAGLDAEIFDGVVPNPATPDIEVGSEALREHGLKDTAVVAVGGGSSLDSGKGIALHAANPGPVEELNFTLDQENPGLPVVAVPTTAGTGSETNYFGVITDPANERKFYVGHPSVRPRASILDPLLTVGLPPGATAATGMDALVHALEALMSRSANPYADGLGLQVIRMVNYWLPLALNDGTSLEGPLANAPGLSHGGPGLLQRYGPRALSRAGALHIGPHARGPRRRPHNRAAGGAEVQPAGEPEQARPDGGLLRGREPGRT